tara:strand:- start:1375 stop:1527 length:153 start_codon:yes stop_codon:yes gene_type:complete
MAERVGFEPTHTTVFRQKLNILFKSWLQKPQQNSQKKYKNIFPQPNPTVI